MGANKFGSIGCGCRTERVNVFYAEMLADPYRLQLVGSMRVTKFGELALPRVTAADRPRAAQTVALYREEDVLAAWKYPAEAALVEDGSAEFSPTDGTARLVRAVAVDHAAADVVRIMIEPNDPIVSGQSLTTMSHESGSWSVTFACRLQVEQGELDTLRLQVPATWAGPFEVSPAAAIEVANTARNGQNTSLSIHLAQPARPGDVVKLEVRSPLALADGQTAAAPHIVPLTHGKWQQFLTLPSLVDGEQIAWTDVGVEPAEPPDDLRSDSSRPGDPRTFRVVRDAMNVSLRPRPTGGSSASVRLAETIVFVGPNGGQFAVTRFVIEPQGLSQCTVVLPGDERLVRAMLDGHPALVRALDQRRWQMQLGPPNLPQTLEIVSRRFEQVDVGARLFELSRPQLQQLDQLIPVELSLWSLNRSASFGTPRVTSAALLTPAEQAVLRLDRLVSISQAATRSAIESSVVDGYNWFANWATQLQAAERTAQALRRPAAEGEAMSRVVRPADDPLSDAVARSEAWIQQVEEVFSETELSSIRPESPDGGKIDPWQDAASTFGDRTCFVADGGQDRLRVELVPTTLTPMQTRFVALASIVGLAIAALRLVRRPAALDFLQHWPEAAGIVVGLAAWAWLRPSWLGLLTVVGCFVLLLRRLYAAKKSPRHDSTKQSNSIPEELAKP